MSADQYATHRISSWDNQGLSKSFDTSQSVQNRPSQPMLPTTYVVPLSRYSSQVHPQFTVDEQQIQPYQQAKLQSRPIETFQPTQNEASKNSQTSSVLKSCKQRISVTPVIGLLVGLIAAGVPLAVMVTLYVQLLSSSNSTTTNTASTTLSTSIGLPYQCSSSVYITSVFNDATHNVNTNTGCCPCESAGTGWHRVTGAAGTQLATFPVSTTYCNSNYPAWFNGTLPSNPGSTTIGTECVNYGGSICNPSYSISNILATNCNGFYVFYLQALSCCCSGIYPRYCTV